MKVEEGEVVAGSTVQEERPVAVRGSGGDAPMPQPQGGEEAPADESAVAEDAPMPEPPSDEEGVEFIETPAEETATMTATAAPAHRERRAVSAKTAAGIARCATADLIQYREKKSVVHLQGSKSKRKMTSAWKR